MWIEEGGARDRVHVAHLDRLSEPASTSELRADTHALLPQVELPELLLEVHAWTGFLDQFTHTSGAATPPTGRRPQRLCRARRPSLQHRLPARRTP